jgi:hypothetical protein
MDDTLNEENNIPEKKSTTSGESNKWIFLGIFLVVIAAGICIFYFGGQEMASSFAGGLAEFAGEVLWQSM